MEANNHHQEMESPHRHMKVLPCFRQDRNGETAPLVQLTGTWMQAAGFCPGDKIEVIIVNDGKLEIRKEVPH